MLPWNRIVESCLTNLMSGSVNWLDTFLQGKILQRMSWLCSLIILPGQRRKDTFQVNGTNLWQVDWSSPFFIGLLPWFIWATIWLYRLSVTESDKSNGDLANAFTLEKAHQEGQIKQGQLRTMVLSLFTILSMNCLLSWETERKIMESFKDFCYFSHFLLFQAITSYFSNVACVLN